ALYLTHEITERSLFLFWPDNPIRQACIAVAQNEWYSRFNLLLILLNCIQLIIESTQEKTAGNAGYGFSSTAQIMASIDATFATLFTLEAVIKSIAGGLLFAGPTSYLLNNWNRLDAIVVVFALLNFVPGFENFTYLRSLRLLR